MKNKDTANTTQKGKEAEDFACAFLENEGYSIEARNFNTRFGEIDIIAKKDGILHFVEVKSGIGFEPIYNITPTKVQKIIKTIEIYLKEYHLNLPYCLSTLILSKTAKQEVFSVSFLENITLF
ncbi:YraN family protein [Helicobacter winghamensis]|uniref:YraN family protein n=1 Tax=Helicobacter winghamensis TaxID=157268 RepID=UPI0024312C32|nr:YraN family protein [Helicobacter winghamensis]